MISILLLVKTAYPAIDLLKLHKQRMVSMVTAFGAFGLSSKLRSRPIYEAPASDALKRLADELWQRKILNRSSDGNTFSVGNSRILPITLI